MPVPESSLFQSPLFPNLFLVGALKCGTSTLHSLLGHHPQILMSHPKEPATLSLITDNLEEGTPVTGRRDIQVWSAAKYLDLFRAQSADTLYRGESSCSYTLGRRAPAIAQLIFELCPNARILYLVRDPFEEMLSHYLMRRRNKRENRCAAQALPSDLYLGPTRYGQHIRPYLDRFGPDQVLILDHEELHRSPDALLEKIFRWLNVFPISLEPALTQKRWNVSAKFRPRWQFPFSRRSPWYALKREDLQEALHAVSSQLVHHRRQLEGITQSPFPYWQSHRGEWQQIENRFGWAIVR